MNKVCPFKKIKTINNEKTYDNSRSITTTISEITINEEFGNCDEEQCPFYNTEIFELSPTKVTYKHECLRTRGC